MLENTGQKTNQKQTLQKLTTTHDIKRHKKEQQNKTSLVQSHLTTLGQKTRWAYSTMLPSPHGSQCSMVDVRFSCVKCT